MGIKELLLRRWQFYKSSTSLKETGNLYIIQIFPIALKKDKLINSFYKTRTTNSKTKLRYI